MIMRNNAGDVVAEQSTVITKEGTTITTNTMFSNGRPVSQTIGVHDDKGNVTTETILNGKLLP